MHTPKRTQPVTDLSAQLSSFATGMEGLYTTLRQEQLQNESLRRELQSLQSEAQESVERYLKIQKEFEEVHKSEQNLRAALDTERRARARAERKQSDLILTNDRRIGEICAVSESERDQHRAEIARVRELNSLEIQAYREELEKLLSRYEALRMQSQQKSAHLKSCASCQELQGRLAAESAANSELREELHEKELTAEEARRTAEQARYELEQARKQMTKIDRISEIQSLLRREKQSRDQAMQQLRSANPVRTENLQSFHPDSLKLEQEITEITKGGHA